MTEEQIKHGLENRFPFLKDQVQIKRQRRLAVFIPYENFREVFEILVKDMEFSILSGITGLDETGVFGVIYHVCRANGIVINVKTSILKEKPLLRSVTAIFASADSYERELVDLLGIEVSELAPGRRYPLPDNWPAGQYPLRKDWKGLPVQEIKEV